MKLIFQNPRVVLGVLALLWTMGRGNAALACDRSKAQADSVIVFSGFYDIYLSVCIGAGITGTPKGGDGPTRDFGFGFYGSPTLSPIGYTNSLTSDTTGATYFAGVGFGAWGTRFLIAYLFSGTDFTCVSSTSTCGNIHTDTVRVRVRTNELPDSVRVFGIEGSGNPLGGCNPDSDMLIPLFGFLPVTWGGLSATQQGSRNQLQWTILSETNNDYFEVQRLGDDQQFASLGRVSGAGNRTEPQTYTFVDEHPRVGPNFYRIRQVDLDGAHSDSETFRADFRPTPALQVQALYPNPTPGRVELALFSEKSRSFYLSLAHQSGELVYATSHFAERGTTDLQLDLSHLPAGIYYLRIAGDGQSVQHKIVRQ
ncbi:MAG: T9SS type A sorting domain-containing protein [Bacteroidota bacterium]